MLPEHVEIVCLLTGDRYGDVYVERLFAMLARHMPVPFRLTLFTDRRRELPPEIRQELLDAWPTVAREAEHPTFLKLRLLSMPFVAEEFLYLDVTLVIRADMTSLLAFAFGRSEDLVTIDDWNYPCYNSSVMRIRRGTFAEIPAAFAAGEIVPMHNLTDQDFIYGYVKEHAQDSRVATFPKGTIVSYKRVRRWNRREPERARSAMAEATIVKFHGPQKMHDLVRPAYRFRRVFLPVWYRTRRWPDTWFWIRELKEHWQ